MTVRAGVTVPRGNSGLVRVGTVSMYRMLSSTTLKPTAAMQPKETHHRYWQKNLRITGALLVIWFLVTFGVGYFARDLDFKFFGWPFSFWVGAQGALIVYVLIIWYYARVMDKLDREHGVAEEE